ncbi:hypothetical protein BDW72DRAFT_180539 [Aspergillus terricola var. indicus]
MFDMEGKVLDEYCRIRELYNTFMSDSSPTACEQGAVRATGRSSHPHGIAHSPGGCRNAQGSSEVGYPMIGGRCWTSDEAERGQGCLWSELTRLPSKHIPGGTDAQYRLSGVRLVNSP